MENSLDQLLGELEGLDDEVRSEITKRIVKAGFKSKELVDRISRASNAKGREEAEAEMQDKFEEFEAKLAAIAESKQKPEPTEEPESDPTGDPLMKHPIILQMQKQNKQVLDALKTVQSQVEVKDQKIETLMKENYEKERNSRLTNLLSASGFDDPKGALALMSLEVDFDIDPSSDDGLMVLKKGKKEPWGDDGFTDGNEFIEHFKSTARGKRFLAAPESATGGTDYTGGETRPRQETTAWDAPEKDLDAQLKSLGVIQ